MMHIQITVFSVCLVFCGFAFWLALRRSLKISYALLWICSAISIVLFTLIPNALHIISRITGLYYETALMLVCFVFVIALFLHISTVISKLIYQNRVLGERLAFLENKINADGKRQGLDSVGNTPKSE
jgi:hypothetical protein